MESNQHAGRLLETSEANTQLRKVLAVRQRRKAVRESMNKSTWKSEGQEILTLLVEYDVKTKYVVNLKYA